MGNDPQEQKETLDIVFDELNRMNGLVNNLILLAKAERFDFLTKETIDISVFTQEIYSKISKLGKRNWQIDDRGRGAFQGDRQRLTQAIINLAQNAVQHTEKTSDTITLGSKRNSQAVSFWIQDTGVGFDPQDRELIFKRFGRADNNHCHSQGQGLGLSIVQAIAQAHKGRVEAIGKLNQGATFTIILPLDKSKN
jgi:signal transduction histidine kinase